MARFNRKMGYRRAHLQPRHFVHGVRPASNAARMVMDGSLIAFVSGFILRAAL
jgi:hypothetical protein